MSVSRRRFTKRAIFVVAIAAVLLLAGATAQAGYLFVLSAGVLALLAASLLVRHRLGSCDVERIVPPRAMVGEDVRIAWRIVNRGTRTLPVMNIEDRFGAFGTRVLSSDRLPPGAEARVDLVASTSRRGVFEGGEIVLSTGAPFGLVTSTHALQVDSRMVVIPRWVDLRSFPILEPGSTPLESLHQRARAGAGQEYHGVREYRPGDPRRLVHWRSTARRGRLVVKELEERTSVPLVVLLAGVDDGSGRDSAFEVLVSAAASIALYALVTGHPVDLVRGGSEGRAERLDEGDRRGILDWLASARPIDTPLDPLIEQAIGGRLRSSTVVVCVTSRGRATEGLERGLAPLQAAGARTIVVLARSDTWSTEAPPVPIDQWGARLAVGGRTVVRVLAKGEDLLSCLEGF